MPSFDRHRVPCHHLRVFYRCGVVVVDVIRFRLSAISATLHFIVGIRRIVSIVFITDLIVNNSIGFGWSPPTI